MQLVKDEARKEEEILKSDRWGPLDDCNTTEAINEISRHILYCQYRHKDDDETAAYKETYFTTWKEYFVKLGWKEARDWQLNFGRRLPFMTDFIRYTQWVKWNICSADAIKGRLMNVCSPKLTEKRR